LRKFRKVPERLLQAPGVRESECAEPGRAVVVMPPKEKCGASGKECGAKKRLLEKMPQGAGAFRRGCRGCGKTNAQGRRAPEAFLLTEKTGFAGVERFRVGTTPPRVFDYGQIH